MVLIRSLLFDLLFYLAMGVMGIVLAPVAAGSRRTAVKVIHLYIRMMFMLLRNLCGLRCEIRGPVPRGDVIIAAKHQSFLDILIIALALDAPRFVMKTELRAAPIFAWYARCLGCIAVDRSAGREAMRHMLRTVQAEQSGIGQLVIYPQGTRVAPGAAHRYRSGASVLHAETGLPCIPAATNAGVFWARNSWYRRPGCAVVEFLPALPPDLSQAEAQSAIEERVEAASAQLLEEAQKTDQASAAHATGFDH